MARCDHEFVPNPPGFPVCIHCGREPIASPSQVSTRKLCPRKHSYQRHRPYVQKASAKFGDVCHGITEAWGKYGTPPPNDTDEGRCVLSGLHYLPLPGTAVHEHPAWPNLFGINWSMRLDWICGFIPNEVVCFGDLKTTRSISEFAHDADYLANEDPQGIIYSHWLAETYDVPHVVGTWVYCQKDAKAKARAVVFTMSRTEAAERFADLYVRYAAPMTHDRVLPPEALPRNLDACNDFGGCDFKSECLRDVAPALIAKHALLRRPMPTKTTADMLAALHANSGTLPAPGAATSTTIKCGDGTTVTIAGDVAPDVVAVLASLPADQRKIVMGSMGLTEVSPIIPANVRPEAQDAARTADITVNVDTTQAKADLQELGEVADQTAAKVEKAAKGTRAKKTADVVSPERLSLLCACASAGMDSTQAEGYLALLGAA